MVGHTVAGTEARRSPGGLRWAAPLLPIGLSVFGLSSLVYYHVRLGGHGDPSGLPQGVVAWLYGVLGFVPAFLGLLMVLVWSSIWFLTGRLERLGARAARVGALVVSVAILVNLRGSAGQPGSGSGELGAWLAVRVQSVFGDVLSVLLVSLVAVASLLVATEFFFYHYFAGRDRDRDVGEGEQTGVEHEVPRELTRLELDEDATRPQPRPHLGAGSDESVVGAFVSPPARATDAGDPDPEARAEEVIAGAGEEARDGAPSRPAACEAAESQKVEFEAEHFEDQEEFEVEDFEARDLDEGEDLAADEDRPEEYDEDEDDDLTAHEDLDRDAEVPPDREIDGAREETLEELAEEQVVEIPVSAAQTAQTAETAETAETADERGEAVTPQGVLSDHDPLLDEAARLVLSANRASATFLQRRLRVSFDEARTLLEQLRDAGIVGGEPGEAYGPVLSDLETWERTPAGRTAARSR